MGYGFFNRQVTESPYQWRFVRYTVQLHGLTTRVHLSPLLFILCTNDCKSIHPNRHLIKFADNTVIPVTPLGLNRDMDPHMIS